MDPVHATAVAQWNATVTDYPRHAVLHDLFRVQAQQSADRIAVVSGGTAWTYGELWSRAEAVASAVAAHGVTRGGLVAVAIPRSPEAVAAIFGVLIAGAAYLPLDPTHPKARLEGIVRASGTELVLTRSGEIDELPGVPALAVDALPPAAETGWQGPPVTADERAYVIYTSGSTGSPKGVAVAHRGIVRLVCGGDDLLQLGPADVLLATTNLTFDVSCYEIFGALLNGARLVLTDKDTLLSAPDLRALMDAEQVTVMWLSAGLFHQHASTTPGMFSTLRRLIAGGDALNPSSVHAILEHGAPGALVNGYGPTENSVFSTAHDLSRLAPDTTIVPIGRPVPNSTAYVLRPDLSLADVGEQGELFVGGDGVALGYHGDPALTKDRFVPDPFNPTAGARLYRTGDMARWRADGVIEFLGRRDRQVKIRGYRVELREIELTLAAHPQVRETAIVLAEPAPGDQRLVAWVILERGAGGAPEVVANLRQYLGDRLPLYMVPSRILVVDHLPLNASGKIDRSAITQRLAQPPAAPLPPQLQPRAGTEQAVARVWRNLLGVEGIARDSNFFELGGQSLQAAQVAAALHRELAVDPGHGRHIIQHLLSNPTLADFAAAVDELVRAAGTDPQASGIDFLAESYQGPLPLPRVRDSASPPRTVLLTGASGFLGTYLIDRLADRGISEIICLVRAKDDATAATRLFGRMRRYGLNPEKVRDCVTVLAGDLAAPRLGLQPARFAQLAEEVDMILHNGSHVNFAYPYLALRPANVGGTREVLRLATSHSLKPIHYVSSIAVIAGFGVAGQRWVEEGTPLAHAHRISLGYVETKWVAERILRQASQHGVPVTIYRPYEITGTTDRGIWNTNTMMCALFRTIAETGIAPDIPLPLDFVPVDFTADAITHIMFTQPADGLVHHVTNAQDARLDLLVDRLVARGYDIRRLSYEQWVSAMVQRAASDPNEPMAPYLPMFVEPAAHSPISIKEMYFAGTFPRFSRDNFERAIAGSHLYCPPVDEKLIDLYLDQFATSGYLLRAH